MFSDREMKRGVRLTESRDTKVRDFEVGRGSDSDRSGSNITDHKTRSLDVENFEIRIRASVRLRSGGCRSEAVVSLAGDQWILAVVVT